MDLLCECCQGHVYYSAQYSFPSQSSIFILKVLNRFVVIDILHDLK